MQKDLFHTIATFTLPGECDMARLRLDAEGIPNRVRDEFTVQVDNFLSHAVGGVKLQVRTEDIQKAIRILQDSGYLSREEVRQGWVEKPLSNDRNLRFARIGLMVFLALAALSVILVYAWLS